MVLRLAILLWDYYNRELGYAYPSRQTLAERLDVDPTNVSHALTRLKRLGVIHIVSVKNISPSAAKSMGRRDRRAHVYVLNIDWAEDFLRDAEDHVSEAPRRGNGWV